MLRYSAGMTKSIPQRELRNNNAGVIDAVVGGATFVITRNGEQVAKLGPIGQQRRTFVSRAEVAALAARSESIDHRQFRRDLDRVVDQAL